MQGKSNKGLQNIWNLQILPVFNLHFRCVTVKNSKSLFFPPQFPFNQLRDIREKFLGANLLSAFLQFPPTPSVYCEYIKTMSSHPIIKIFKNFFVCILCMYNTSEYNHRSPIPRSFLSLKCSCSTMLGKRSLLLGSGGNFICFRWRNNQCFSW